MVKTEIKELNSLKKKKYQNHIEYTFADEVGEAIYSQQKQDLELTVAQIINSLLQNSGLNLRK